MVLRKGNQGTAGASAPRLTAQQQGMGLAESFLEVDRAGLERMDAAGRAEQERLRTALFLYADALWDHAKARSRAQGAPGAGIAGDPACSGVAGMRDLAAELVATVHDVQVSVGDRD